jgi:hypothetical protein
VKIYFSSLLQISVIKSEHFKTLPPSVLFIEGKNCLLTPEGILETRGRSLRRHRTLPIELTVASYIRLKHAIYPAMDAIVLYRKFKRPPL